MSNKKRFSPEKKAAILRAHFTEGRPVSDLADEYGFKPTDFESWQKQLFEGALQIFAPSPQKKDSLDKKVKVLEETLQKRDSLIAELASENVELKKKSNGVF